MYFGLIIGLIGLPVPHFKRHIDQVWHACLVPPSSSSSSISPHHFPSTPRILPFSILINQCGLNETIRSCRHKILSINKHGINESILTQLIFLLLHFMYCFVFFINIQDYLCQSLTGLTSFWFYNPQNPEGNLKPWTQISITTTTTFVYVQY